MTAVRNEQAGAFGDPLEGKRVGLEGETEIRQRLPERRRGARYMNSNGKTCRREAAEALTPRELEIVRMVARGLRNRAIAEQLFISEGTVKIHLHNIYQKIEIDGRLERLCLEGPVLCSS